MVAKTKISFVVPHNLKAELHERIIKDGYGLRGKSRWISEAVEELLKYKKFFDLISYGDEMSGFDKTETVVIENSLKIKLEEAIIAVRGKFPMLEGVKSRILRTAILQRVLRS